MAKARKYTTEFKEQAENPEGSIRNQEMRLREYVKLKNLMEPFGEIVSLHSDPGVSAKDMNRPGFQKMLAAIERHEVDLVLVTELSRFSRSTKDFANLQEFLEDHDCKFMSIRENFDTSGAAGVSCRRYGTFTCAKAINNQEPQISAQIEKEFRSAKSRISTIVQFC